MTEWQRVCDELAESAEGAIGCAVIDFDAPQPLAAAVRSDTVLEANGMDLISGAVSEMFDGRLIRQFQRAWSDTRDAGEFVREVQIATANSHCFISAVPGRDDRALVLITDKTVSLGLGWMSVHQALAGLPDAPPPAVAQPRDPAADPVAAPGSATPASPEQPPPTAAPEPSPKPEASGNPARTGARPRMAAPPAPSGSPQPSPREEPPPPAPESGAPLPEPATEPDQAAQAAEPEEQPTQPETVPERGRQRTYRGIPVGKRGSGKKKGDDASTPRWSARYRGFSDGGGRSRPPRSDS